MTKDKMLPLSLLFLSTFMLFLGFSYKNIEKRVASYSYSDKEEFNDMNKAINYIETLPIHINIINQYFSSINNLDKEQQQEIIISYALKNNYKIYDCSDTYSRSICINKDDLNSQELQKLFNTNITFDNNTIDINIDRYGKVRARTNNYLSYYKININNYNKKYNKYTEFYKYKKENDKYIFYVYEGYYESNCIPNSKIELNDFLDEDIKKEGICSPNKTFISDYSVDGIQLYKYELKKDQEDNFYLVGFNPVNKEGIKKEL